MSAPLSEVFNAHTPVIVDAKKAFLKKSYIFLDWIEDIGHLRLDISGAKTSFWALGSPFNLKFDAAFAKKDNY